MYTLRVSYYIHMQLCNKIHISPTSRLYLIECTRVIYNNKFIMLTSYNGTKPLKAQARIEISKNNFINYVSKKAHSSEVPY